MKKTVLITGCSSGIGKAAALVFADRGWNVVATLRRPEAEEELARRSDLFVTRLDVQDRDSIGAAIEAGIARFGAIDVLVNNAGFGQFGLFEEIPREKVQEQFDVNVFGLMDVTRAILPHFRMNQAGLIINISSGVGLVTRPMISLYCASKFALEGFSEALAYELASQNIGVKLVEPHGGISGTRFGQRVIQEYTEDATLEDYADFVDRMSDADANRPAEPRISAAEVAQVIYEAATDGTERLRYLIGHDSRGFIKARQELADQAYVEFLRAQFRPKP
jgi:NAD(P)-dependent dehydrogenase (short-subunit alcohol dehydrogenase family)